MAGRLTDLEFFGRFGEAFRVLRAAGESAEVTGRRVRELYRRHSDDVTRVVREAIAGNAAELADRAIPDTSLLRMILGGGAAVRAETPPAPPRPNVIRRRGTFWAVRFGGGEEQVYRGDVGFVYLAALLRSPGRLFAAAELDALVPRGGRVARRRGEAAADGLTATGPGRGEELTDAEGRDRLTTRLRQVEEGIGLFRESAAPDRLDRIEELQVEREAITRALAAAAGFRGRPARALDDRNKVRNRVCNAVRRVIGRVERDDRRLAAHLAPPVLTLGHNLRYTPPDGTTWATGATDTAGDTEPRGVLHAV